MIRLTLHNIRLYLTILNEIDHDMKNYEAEVNELRLDNSSHHVKTEFTNCFKQLKITDCRMYLRKPFLLFHLYIYLFIYNFPKYITQHSTNNRLSHWLSFALLHFMQTVFQVFGSSS